MTATASQPVGLIGIIPMLSYRSVVVIALILGAAGWHLFEVSTLMVGHDRNGRSAWLARPAGCGPT